MSDSKKQRQEAIERELRRRGVRTPELIGAELKEKLRKGDLHLPVHLQEAARNLRWAEPPGAVPCAVQLKGVVFDPAILVISSGGEDPADFAFGCEIEAVFPSKYSVSRKLYLKIDSLGYEDRSIHGESLVIETDKGVIVIQNFEHSCCPFFFRSKNYSVADVEKGDTKVLTSTTQLGSVVGGNDIKWPDVKRVLIAAL